MRIATYVINLDRCTERRQRISEHLSKLALDFEIIKAVDGAEIDTAQHSTAQQNMIN
ncbi:glycosyltransferase family 25 protein [Pseudoalteromonas sp. T1lg22]|uniref:glycosyltransferase family 25 protein n=1 Tax=Pseudoalteromonas sp. T1lg22 TaxID=2077096 RepID=UPI00131A45C5|nr:glycosyltransferase family 25 protein [Pseudoalteromonas sp. T1lg22]